MRPELLEIVREKAEKIKNFIDTKKISLEENEIKSKWNSYIPKPKEVHVVASDGSLYSKQYLGYFLGVFGGYAEEFNPDNEEQNSNFVGDIYISLIKQPENFKTLLTLFMFLSEIKSTYNLAKEKEPKLIILDGTLTSRFIIPFPLPNWFTKNNEKDIYHLEEIVKELYYDKIKSNCLNYKSIYSLSEEIYDDILDRIEDKYRIDFIEIVRTQLVYYEYLITLYNLLTLDFKPIVIGFAKTSTGTELLNSSIPDIKLFLEHCNMIGYSEKVYQNLQKLKSNFGNLKEIDNDFNNKLYEIFIESFYTKYSDTRSINLVEYCQNEGNSIDIEELINYIAGTNADGSSYPFILKRMDKEVRITNEDFKLIERALEFTFAKTGREVLY